MPKKIVDTLHLRKGSLFNIRVAQDRIELVPLEVTEKFFTAEDLKGFDKLAAFAAAEGEPRRWRGDHGL